MAQKKGESLTHLAHQHPNGTICTIGEPKPGLVVPPPAISRNNANPAVFEVTFGAGVPTAAKTAFNRATAILSNLISTPFPISVQVSFDELEDGTLAGAFPGTYLQNFQNAPLRRTWYPIALAEKIAQREFNSNNVPYDIQVNVNKNVNWHYATQGIEANEFDFVTVILHELIHGLGFAASGNVNGNQGSMLLQGFPVAYGRFVENSQKEKLIGNFTDPSIELGNQLTSNNLFIETPSLRNTGNSAKIYAPSTFSRGSSISHLDRNTFIGTVNTLMTPSINPGAIIHNPGIALDILYDLGWSFTNIIHEPGTGEEDVTKPYVVNARIVSDNGFQSSSIELHYSQDSFKTETILPMQPSTQTDEFQATIPAPNKLTQYQYYITVKDNRDVLFISPSEAPNPLFYEFFYDVDETKPEITHEAIENLDDKASGLAIEASVTDFFTGVKEVIIEYKINGEIQPPVPMEKDFMDGFRPDLYIGTIPLPTQGLSENDILEYRIIAKDKSPSSNTINAPLANEYYTVKITKTLAPVSLYVNDFEFDKSDFNGNGFAHGQPSSFTNQAIHSNHPYTNAGENNTRNFVYNLRIPIIIRKVDAHIEFDEIVLVEPGEDGTKYTDTEFWDYVIVEGRRTNSSTWLPFLPGYDSKADPTWLATYNSNISQQISRASGNPRLFRNRVINMQENGNFAAGDTVLIRFRLFSDPFAVGWGWAIDDLKIQDSPVAVEDFIEQEAFTIYPNPNRGQELHIKANFKQKVPQIDLVIRDVHGRLIKQESYLSIDKIFQQSVDISLLPKGLYILTLHMNQQEQISKKIIRY
jgi:hypothetical protein